MDTQTALQAKMQTECATLRCYAQSDVSKTLVKMLDTLVEIYKIDLMHVTPEYLTRLQAAIRQTKAIRDVVADESSELPKI